MADKPKRPAGLPATQRIGILVFDGFEPIDVFGFAEAFTIARFLGQGYQSEPPYPFETVLIAKQAAKVKSMNGPWVMPDWDFDQAIKEPLDVLMVPGGGGTEPLLDDPAVIEWMRAMDDKVRIMASVCIGAAVLAKSGVLDGLPAATNQAHSRGWPIMARGCAGTTSRDGSMPANTSPLPGSRPAPISASTWYRGWPAGRSPKSRRYRPNTIGTAIPTSRSSIRNKPTSRTPIHGASPWIGSTSCPPAARHHAERTRQ